MPTEPGRELRQDPLGNRVSQPQHLPWRFVGKHAILFGYTRLTRSFYVYFSLFMTILEGRDRADTSPLRSVSYPSLILLTHLTSSSRELLGAIPFSFPFPGPAGDRVAPHSGQRSGVSRRSYPQRRHLPILRFVNNTLIRRNERGFVLNNQTRKTLPDSPPIAATV